MVLRQSTKARLYKRLRRLLRGFSCVHVCTNCWTVPLGYIRNGCKVSGDFQIIECGRLNFRRSEMYRFVDKYRLRVRKLEQNRFTTYEIYSESELI